MTEDFSEDHLLKDAKAFMWGDEPFVATVFCQKSERGYLTDWWVSGRRWTDDSPTLVLRLRIGVNAQADDLRSKLLELWDTSLREVSFGSAIYGGVQNPSQDLKELDEAQRNSLFDFHLQGHSRYGHFNIKGKSKIEKTANMYLLLKSLGSKQPQKAIAFFESIPNVSEVKASIINQRLALARQSGYLSRERDEPCEVLSKPTKERPDSKE